MMPLVMHVHTGALKNAFYCSLHVEAFKTLSLCYEVYSISVERMGKK